MLLIIGYIILFMEMGVSAHRIQSLRVNPTEMTRPENYPIDTTADEIEGSDE